AATGARPHAARTTALYQDLYHRAPTGQELDSFETLIQKARAGGATVDQAYAFGAALMRNTDDYRRAHPTGPWIDKLFSDGVGRAPTTKELNDCEALIQKLLAQGKHVFEAGAVLTFLMRAGDEFKRKHPLAPMYDALFQENLGRPANLEEIAKTDELARQWAAQGKNIFEIAQGVTFLLRLGDEYKARHPGQVVSGYVSGVPRTITVSDIGNGQRLRTDAAEAYKRMEADAARAGIHFYPESGFRTMEQQQHLYSLYLQGRGNLAARPGYSNHQGGISLDIGGTGGYGGAAYRWLAANAARYGFRNDVGGEPWHWTYGG
ncbi:MAG: D-alanyl-D-alanine carboxypeptidase family protein, partial [Myxococcales bacterium]|nr:D-alanyl-D-alanine carboxypeptidase family protein [Myxococcales bacterium]